MRCKSFWVIGLLVLAGCDTGGTQRREPGEAGMKRFESEAEFQEYFAAQVRDSTTGFSSDEVRGGDAVVQDGDLAPPSAAEPGTVASDGSIAAADYSGTTQQEAGVQEGDIIKNDGTYIYVLSQGSLRIVQANPGESLREVSSVTLDGYGQELYLVGDRLVALTRPDSFYPGPIPLTEPAFDLVAPDYSAYRPRVKAAVIDVTDRVLPAVQSTSAFEGDLHSSRLIDGTLHLVLVNYPDFFAPYIEFRGGAAVMAQTTTGDILPDFEIQIGEAEPIVGEIVEVTDVYRPNDPDGYGMTTVLSLDIDNPAGFRSVGVVAYPGNIYASTEALYLTNSEFNFTRGSSETTSISKFAFTDAGPVLVAAGAVPGRVLNQYSMSEHEGFLRVATTVQSFDFTGAAPPPPTNNVYVLGQQGEELAIVGRAENLAPGETIYAARFYGEKGYLVTFEQVDPLFTLDLADPTTPKAVGELKVPGFSTFIVQMDATHLLTIGQDVSLEFGFPIPNGVQLSIFDVSDFANPRLVATEKVAGLNAYSEALYNPKALTFLASQGLVALPIEYYDFGFAEPGVIVDAPPPSDGATEPAKDDATGQTVDGSHGQADSVPPPAESFRGVYVYHADAASGFSLLGRLGSVQSDDAYYYYSSFNRGVFMGDNVFAVNDLGVTGAPRTAIVEPAAWQLSFPLPEPIPPDEIEPEPARDDAVSSDGAVISGGGGGSAPAGAK